MKIRTSLVHLTALCFLTCRGLAQNEPPQAHIVSLTLDQQNVTVLHLHPGFVSSVRLPEEVSSVVLGDPAAFKGEQQGEPTEAATAFLPVRVVDLEVVSPRPAPPIEILLPTGMIVRAPSGFDPHTLGHVLAVLEGRPC